jgi:hypothetical protein
MESNGFVSHKNISELTQHTMKCVLAVISIQMVDFSIEYEARIGNSVGYSSNKRSKVTRSILKARFRKQIE